MKAAHEMTSKEFYKRYGYQHSLLRDTPDAHDAIMQGGFRQGMGPNAMTITQGPPSNVMQQRYGTKTGVRTYAIPGTAVHQKANGPQVKEGHVPEVSFVPEHDHEPAHRAVIREAIRDGKPVPPNVAAEYPDLAKPTGDWRSMAKEYRQGGVIDAPEAKKLRARYDTLAQGEKSELADHFGIMGASGALPEVRDNLVHRKINDMEFRGRGDGPPIHREQKNKLFGTPGVGESEDLFGAEEPGSQWEPGAIKDLLKDAKNRYSGADKKTLRPIIDKDTHYLGNMDIGLLKEPAKEAGVQIAKEHDAEKVRSLIRDKIEQAVGVQ